MSDESPPSDSTATVVNLAPVRGSSPSLEPGAPALFAGRYALEALVGTGGMGKVYRARDVLVGDVVALKTLELGKEPGTEALERFRREVRLARRISHPHVARMHDLGEHAGQHYLTMEYIEGEDLHTLLHHEGARTPVQAARVALAVCEGLAAAHAAGVVHRDLKPANVLLEAGGRVVLTDFGIARALVDEAASRTQGTVGTPMYMAPEQLSGGEVDARADLYAVGLMLYQMLTGALPFSGDSTLAIAFARLRQPPPDPRARAAVPDALAGLVLHCLAREPGERPSSALELARALRAWLESMGEPSPAPGPTSPPPRPFLPPPPGAPPAQDAPTVARSTVLTSRLAGGTGLAVLPLRFQGAPEQEHLGEGLTDALLDVLSRTQGLRVPSGGATARFRQEREPRVVGRELGVDFLVDGMVQSAGSRVRVSVRLVETGSATQVWSGRFEDSSEEPFELQDRLGLRLAEALRIELLLATRPDLPPEALAPFRQGLIQGYTPGNAPHLALAELERCLELAPDFGPAQALHALFSLRMWFLGWTNRERDWEALARASVARVEQHAPHLAETHLARAMLAGHSGDWRQAVLRAREAIRAAPSFAVAQQYLGSLQCEAGRAEEGLAMVRRAYEQDSKLGLCLFELARGAALRGQLEEYRWASERLASFTAFRIPALMLRLRVSAWQRDSEDVRRCQRALEDEPGPAATNGLRYASAVLGEVDPLASLVPIDAMLAGALNPRYASLLCQFATEQLCLTGHPEKALEYFLRAAGAALIDLEWTDRCPALAPLRALPGFAEGRRQIRARVQAIWTG